MKRTENLSLPIYDNPESDIFKINDVNNAHETIDKQYKELKNIKETVESTNPSANLQGQINDINASLDNIEKKQDWFSEEFKGNTFVAHRGYSNQYPENTLKSYYEASKVGFKAWECDPWYSTDGVWFNMHDTTVDRTTDGTGNTHSFSWSELSEMNLDHGNNILYNKGLKIPTIEEILKLASTLDDNPVIFLNIRGSLTEESSKSLVNLIVKYNYIKKSIIFCGIDNLKIMRKLLPEIGLCCDSALTLPTDGVIQEMSKLTPNAMISIANGFLIDEESGQILINKCRNKGLFIQAHSVGTLNVAKKVIESGVNIILSDVISSEGGVI